MAAMAAMAAMQDRRVLTVYQVLRVAPQVHLRGAQLAMPLLVWLVVAAELVVTVPTAPMQLVLTLQLSLAHLASRAVMAATAALAEAAVTVAMAAAPAPWH